MPATLWKAAIDLARGAVWLSLILALALGLPSRRSIAGSTTDSRTQTKALRWTAASQRRSTPPAKRPAPMNPLRWGAASERNSFADARQSETPSTAEKHDSEVWAAVHEQAVDVLHAGRNEALLGAKGRWPSQAVTVSGDGPGGPSSSNSHSPIPARVRYSGASAEIRLTSFSETTDDPALDPFQDEIIAEEDGEDEQIAEEAAEDQSGGDEIVDDAGEIEMAVEEGQYDSAELAQRGDRRSTELPDDLHLNLDDLDTQLPKLETEYAQADPGEPERCPSPRDLKPINQITHRIAAEPGLFPQECALSDYPFQPRNFKTVTFTWKASALCHKPLYFQQPKLERYGHTFGPILTPIVSIGHFFVMVPCLPYNMGMEPPWECVYPLGWYRPGDCAPYTLGPLPLSLRGAATQGVITTGLWFIFP